MSFTKNRDKKSSQWTGFIRRSLRQLDKADGKFIEDMLIKQAEENNSILYPLSDDDSRKLRFVIRTQNNIEVVSTVPEDTELDELAPGEDMKPNESKKIQALIAKIGERMGFKIWLPKSDRSRVLENWQPENNVLLEVLPLNYDEVTTKTIENIDVIWLRGHSIVRAFEVEHTTSIYSGILRIADLMALQPNINIRVHIVAPLERKGKVFEEIKRPVFTLLQKGPLFRSCTFISYDALRDVADQQLLEHMADSVIDEYSEEASEDT